MGSVNFNIHVHIVNMAVSQSLLVWLVMDTFILPQDLAHDMKNKLILIGKLKRSSI